MRWIFWASVSLAAGVVLTGLSRNAGSKFVRTQRQQGCLFNYANVTDSRMQLPKDLLCCTGSAHDEAVCAAGRHRKTKLLTSKWALVIPLAALAVNAFCDWLAGGATAARRRARWNRFWLYTAVILVRTLVLYFGLNYVQGEASRYRSARLTRDAASTQVWKTLRNVVLVQAKESSNCWYAHLRRSGRCSEHFDFADHVVLGVCQYFAIQVFEFCCIIREYRDVSRTASTAAASSLQRKSSASSTSSSYSASSTPSSSSQPPPGPPSSQLIFALPAATVCVVVAGGSLLLVYDTVAFFHTRAETVAAMAISWFTIGSPLLGLMTITGGDGRSGGGAGWCWAGISSRACSSVEAFS
ncbi:unnamed protein product [Pylaiella littoralis]